MTSWPVEAGDRDKHVPQSYPNYYWAYFPTKNLGRKGGWYNGSGRVNRRAQYSNGAPGRRPLVARRGLQAVRRFPS